MGSTLAIHAIGAYYENGFHVKKNLAKAKDYYITAANK